MSSLVITIDASPDIVMSASPVSPTDIGITDFNEPTPLAQNLYAPDSPFITGSVPLGWRFEQSLISFTVAPFGAATEAEARALIGELRAAVSRLGYLTTINVNGSGDEVWRCDAGSVTPAGSRNWVNVKHPNVTEWNVTIPCYPVRVS